MMVVTFIVGCLFVGYPEPGFSKKKKSNFEINFLFDPFSHNGPSFGHPTPITISEGKDTRNIQQPTGF